MIKGMYVLGLVAISIIGCQSNQTKQQNIMRKFIHDDFYSLMNEFPDSLVKHFPQELEGTIRNYGSGFRDTPMKIKYLTLAKEASKDELLLYNGMGKTPDSCLFKIYANRIEYGFNYAAHGNCNELLPIPVMALVTNDDIGIVDYYVLQTSKQVIYNNDQYLRHYLPDEWKNGMSRGVGISESTNTIFYWLLIW